MKYVQGSDIKIAYQIAGVGTPLILIGGYSLTKESWQPLVPYLSDHFQVITFDNRGVGGTVGDKKEFSVADMAADTVALMDSLGIDKAHFFGISMGGLIAQNICLDYPERVLKTVLGCTTHGGREAVPGDKAAMQSLADAANPAIARADSLKASLPFSFSDNFRENNSTKVDDFIKQSLAMNTPKEGLKGQMGALSVYNSKPRLAEIDLRILILTGDEDVHIPAENSELLQAAIPAAELTVVKGAGHLFYLEQPEFVGSNLVKFLQA